jgi:hypothetical protein
LVLNRIPKIKRRQATQKSIFPIYPHFKKTIRLIFITGNSP